MSFTAKRKLSFKEKISYGIGDVSNGLAVSSVSVWYQFYLTDIVGLMVLYAGAAVLVGRLWDAVTDPLMGWITDHTKSRWGKRRPYLLLGAIPYAFAYFLMWSTPQFDSQLVTFFYVAGILILFNTCLTVVFVPYTSLTAAISNDYDERTSLTGYRMVCSQTAFLLGAALPPALIGWVKNSENSSHPLVTSMQSFGFELLKSPERLGYVIFALLFSTLMVASIWTTFFGCKESSAEEAVSTKAQKQDKSSPWSYAANIIRELKRNPPFLFAVLILLLANSAATLQAANLPYYLRYVLGIEDQTFVLLTLFGSAIASVPLWVNIARRYGKAETFSGAMLFYTVVLCVMPFIQPSIGSYIYIAAALIGFSYAAALTIPWAIVPDVVEYDELENGTRREGLFYGGTTFTYKSATGVAFLLSTLVLWLCNYQAGVVQTSQANAAIRFLIGPAPAVFLLAAAFLAVRYPLNAKKHAEILDKLAERDAAKAIV